MELSGQRVFWTEGTGGAKARDGIIPMWGSEQRGREKGPRELTASQTTEGLAGHSKYLLRVRRLKDFDLGF